MFSTRWVLTCTLIGLFLVLSIGCSGGSRESTGIPLTPDITPGQAADRSGATLVSHSLLGLYSCRFNPESEMLETVPLRDSMFHLNALRFLEPPPPVNMYLKNFEYDGQTIDVDVELHHPFAGLLQFTGFDVRGIVIASGSIAGFSDPDIVIAGEGDTRLLNPDGLTRWWNPREFPYNEDFPLWGYIDGIKGTPDEWANYSATLNGYKYFANGLDVDAPLTELDTSKRGAFLVGTVNSRHYTIELDAGLTFNYAIDACWDLPKGDPIVVPDSFPESANCEEPYFLMAEVVSNTLWYDVSTGSGGGELGLDIHSYDWFKADQNTVRVESPGVFLPATSTNVTGGTDNYSTYHVDLTDPILSSMDPITLWVSAEADDGYEGLLPGKPTAAYMPPFQADVFAPQQTGIHLEWTDEIPIDHPLRTVHNDIDPALVVNGEGQVLCAFFFWYDVSSSSWYNKPRYATSYDNGHTFGVGEIGYWDYHSVNIEWLCSNGKYTLGSDGMAFHSYLAPCGHTLHRTPKFEEYQPSGSHSGTIVEHAGEMLYTSEGYPMMFGDEGGTILMRRGDIPNIAGTGTWPTFTGTEYVLVAEALLNYISESRSTGKTSDGICHLIFFHPSSNPYIRMVSSTDITGTDWGEPVDVYVGLAEIWVNAKDPSLWIDDSDGFHTLFAAEDWMGNYHLMYGYSVDGSDWDEMTSFSEICTMPVDDGLNDTQVVVFDAFDETMVFISYETKGNVWCRYKKFEEDTFSDPIQVNVHAPAALPDIMPNGDVGVVFAYQADDGTGNDLTDIYYRLAEWVED